MSKFRKGETSAAKLNEKEEKTKGLLLKMEKLKAAVSQGIKIPSLDKLRSTHGISFKALLAWTDHEAGLNSCSFNTSQSTHNIKISNKLKEILHLYNNNESKIARNMPSTGASIKNSSKKEARTLREENTMLRNSLAEVYRAYEQLLARVDESTKRDIRYQQALKAHTQALGKADIRLITHDN
ncbi:hypothetical protein [Pseudomonas aeruginosa]|uniref:hypothetical protein n=1 Tax=Pseudomonas aeruginosa TaxID=287 RepID=UPI000AD4C46C|nr:hypothetical protein [Pseudomonas aeruginosa]RTR54481.1 hypothetical protein DY931_32080 [Pseudomonas aeruginosa]RTR63988.1 hypothetical protein DY930_34310 [Pseudomonas aeruginosa]